MKYIEIKNQEGNHWKLETEPNPKYPHKGQLFLNIDGKKIKVMNFITLREYDMFWDLLSKEYDGVIKEKTQEVQYAGNEN